MKYKEQSYLFHVVLSLAIIQQEVDCQLEVFSCLLGNKITAFPTLDFHDYDDCLRPGGLREGPLAKMLPPPVSGRVLGGPTETPRDPQHLACTNKDKHKYIDIRKSRSHNLHLATIVLRIALFHCKAEGVTPLPRTFLAILGCSC